MNFKLLINYLCDSFNITCDDKGISEQFSLNINNNYLNFKLISDREVTIYCFLFSSPPLLAKEISFILTKKNLLGNLFNNFIISYSDEYEVFFLSHRLDLETLTKELLIQDLKKFLISLDNAKQKFLDFQDEAYKSNKKIPNLSSLTQGKEKVIIKL